MKIIKLSTVGLGIGIGLAVLSIAAVVKYYTDYPNNAAPGPNYAISLDTRDHTAGGTPYNYITIAQLPAVLSAQGIPGYIPTVNGNGTNTTFWGVTSFDEIDANNFYPTNTFWGTNWPPAAPTTYGQAFVWNSNGSIFNVQSKVNALTWTKTNAISAP